MNSAGHHIGAGVAILLNWYMPSYRQEIERVRGEEIEDKMREVLEDVGIPDDWKWKNDGEVLQLLKEKLSEAREYGALRGESFNQRSDLRLSIFRNAPRSKQALGNHGC